MSETLLVATDAGVTTLTLNRPTRRNALTPEMQLDLTAALHHAASDPACRVVVLAGSGEAFCAGLDLKVLADLPHASAHQHATDAARVAAMFRALYGCSKPTIAQVHGAAIGGGAGLATICDFTLAEQDAWFAYSEVKIGFVPALVSAYLVLQLGEKRARDLLLTGRVVAPDEAYLMGLVTEVVPRGTLQQRVRELTGTLIQNSPSSLRATKALLAAQNNTWLDAAIAHSMTANAESRDTPDFREGVAAFLEKRKPVWSRVAPGK